MAPFTFANTGFSVGQSAEEPIGVVRTSGGIFLGAASLVSYHADENSKARVNGLDELLPTVDASNRFGLTMAFLTEYYGNGNPIPLDEPMRTVTSHDREALLAAHVAVFKGKDKGQNAGEPLRTITAGGGEFGAVQTVIERYDGGRDLGYWPEIRKLLNKYCGYKLAEDEVLLLVIGGVPYYIRDILLRMLAPRELYNAMGFPPDYVIDFIDPKTGKDYPKSAKVARCGNAVCPPMAEAVVRANLPEWCGGKIETMAELRRHVAV
jgi:DNA (cytosine-5)-methyltransferase 1